MLVFVLYEFFMNIVIVLDFSVVIGVRVEMLLNCFSDVVVIRVVLLGSGRFVVESVWGL